MDRQLFGPVIRIDSLLLSLSRLGLDSIRARFYFELFYWPCWELFRLYFFLMDLFSGWEVTNSKNFIDSIELFLLEK